MIEIKIAIRTIAKITLTITLLLVGQTLAMGQQTQRTYYVDSIADDPSMSFNDRDGRITLREAVMAATSRRPFGDAAAGRLYNRVSFERLFFKKQGTRIVLNAPIEVNSRQNSTVFITDVPSVRRNVVIDGDDQHKLFRVGGLATLKFHRVDLVNGRGINGGAISVEDSGQLSFSLGEITNCHASQNGGAVHFNSSGDLDLTNASLIGNFAGGSGGAVSMIDGDLDIERVTVAENQAGSYGGGLHIHSSFASMNVICDTTIVDNHAYSTGPNPQAGGIAETVGSTGSVYLDNVLVARNTAPVSYVWPFPVPNDINATVHASSRSNLLGSVFGNIGITDGVNRNQLGTVFSRIEPMLSTLAYHGSTTSRNFIPNPNSPAIDAGDPTPSTVPGFQPIDQRGNPRFVRGFADIGSIERQLFP